MLNAGYQVPQFQAVPNMQFGLSDADVMRIAIQTKQLLSDEIERLVQEQVKKETADLRDTVESLKQDNDDLRECMHNLERALSTKIDDLEQQSSLVRSNSGRSRDRK